VDLFFVVVLMMLFIITHLCHIVWCLPDK